MNETSNNNARIVIIDDEPEVCRSYVDELVWGCGFNVESINCFTDPREALTFLEANHQEIDAVLLDLQMPHIDGLDMLRHIRNLDDSLKIIVTSAFAGIASVKIAVKTDAEADILEKAIDKPVADFSAIKRLINEAHQQKRSTQ